MVEHSQPFSLSQGKFYDGSQVVVITSNRALLRGTLEKHKKGKNPPRWLLLISVPLSDDGSAETKPPRDEAALLLDSTDRAT